MNIREALAAEHSKRQTNAIVKYVGNDPKRFAELMKVFLSNEYRPVQRASWAISCCVENHPQLASSYFTRLLSLLEREDVHTGAHRNILRMFQFVDVPSWHRGRLYDICAGFLDDPSRPIPVRVFAVSVAAKIAAGKESLLAELRLLTATHPPRSSPALRARAAHVLGDGKYGNKHFGKS
jgi:hypothetical protein